MSYTQYQQYGGNPYNNGPNAEAGQGGQVSFSSALDGMRARQNETMTDLTLSWTVGISRTTRIESRNVQLLPDVELLQCRCSGRTAYLDHPHTTRFPGPSRLRQIRDSEPEFEHPGDRLAASTGPVLTRQQFFRHTREPGHADAIEEHPDPRPDQIPGGRCPEDGGWHEERQGAAGQELEDRV
jgi:hypothetical protein